MNEPKTRSGAWRVSTFVLVGGFAAAVNWGSRFALSAMGLSLSVAVVIAYLIGMSTAYVLLRGVVFEKSGRSPSNEIARFAIVNLVALAQVWLVTMGLDHWLLPMMAWSWRPAEVAHAIGVASPLVSSYLGHRYFTFEHNKKAKDASSANTMTRR